MKRIKIRENVYFFKNFLSCFFKSSDSLFRFICEPGLGGARFGDDFYTDVRVSISINFTPSALSYFPLILAFPSLALVPEYSPRI